MTVTNASDGRRSRTRTPSTRLPSTRERRPALAALAVLLIAGGSVLAGWLALRASHDERYVQMHRAVGIGHQIGGGDLQSVELPSGHGELVPWSDRRSIVGKYAVETMKAGYIVSRSMFGEKGDPKAGSVIVGISPGQYAPDVVVGATIKVQVLDDQKQSLGTTKGIVTGVKEPAAGSGGTAQVSVQISSACADAVSAASNQQDIALQVMSPADYATMPDCQGLASDQASSTPPTTAPTKHHRKSRTTNR